MTYTPIPVHETTCEPRSHLARYLSVAGVLLILTLGWAGAGTASAGEFNPDPGATASAACVADALGTDITVTMTNVAGLADAHFTVDSFAYGPTTHTVAPGQTEVFVLDGVPERVELELTVTADYGTVLTQTFTTDCYSYLGQLVPRCDGEDAYLDLHVERTGELATTIHLDVDGQTVVSQWVDSAWDTSLPVATGTPLDVVVANNRDGLVVRHDSPIYCEPPVNIPDTTVPVTTVIDDTTSTDVPRVLGTGATVPSEIVHVDQPQQEQAATELAFTGGETTLMAVIGGLLLAAGLTCFTVTRRLRR